MRPQVIEICQHVAAHFGFVTVDDIRGPSRMKGISEARALAQWLTRAKLGMSYPELGREFGKDHTSCRSACQRVERASGTLLSSARMLFAELEETSRVRCAAPDMPREATG